MLDVRVVGESRSVELKEHFDELGTIEVLCLGKPNTNNGFGARKRETR